MGFVEFLEPFSKLHKFYSINLLLSSSSKIVIIILVKLLSFFVVHLYLLASSVTFFIRCSFYTKVGYLNFVCLCFVGLFGYGVWISLLNKLPYVYVYVCLFVCLSPITRLCLYGCLIYVYVCLFIEFHRETVIAHA